MSKDEYLLKSREEKLSMISDYYNQIKRVRNCFLLFFVVWIHHCLKFITGHFLNNSNGTVSLSVTASSSAGMGTLKKANMLFLTKEATNKDQTLKIREMGKKFVFEYC